MPLLVVEEPRDSQRPPADQARLDRRHRPETVSGLPPQRGTPRDLRDALRPTVEALDRWISGARRCRIPSFVKLQKSIVKHKVRTLAAIEHNLSNGLIESTNKIRLISRILLVDSIRPLERLCSIAARVLTLCLTMLFWSFTNDGIRHRRAQLIHRSRASTVGRRASRRSRGVPL